MLPFSTDQWNFMSCAWFQSCLPPKRQKPDRLKISRHNRPHMQYPTLWRHSKTFRSWTFLSQPAFALYCRCHDNGLLAVAPNTRINNTMPACSALHLMWAPSNRWSHLELSFLLAKISASEEYSPNPCTSNDDDHDNQKNDPSPMALKPSQY